MGDEKGEGENGAYDAVKRFMSLEKDYSEAILMIVMDR